MGQLIDFAADFADLLITHNGLRSEAGSNVNGRWVPGGTSPFTFKGTYPQPAGQDDFALLPEGSQLNSTIVIHSVQALKRADNQSGNDVVLWEGGSFMVMQSDRRNHLGCHYRNVLTKVQDLE